MDIDQIKCKINQRRKQILIHSRIYYRLGNNIVDDKMCDKWAYELAELQNKYPEIAKTSVYSDNFKGFDGTTGFNLPLDEYWVVDKTDEILRLVRENNKDKILKE